MARRDSQCSREEKREKGSSKSLDVGVISDGPRHAQKARATRPGGIFGPLLVVWGHPKRASAAERRCFIQPTRRALNSLLETYQPLYVEHFSC